MNKSMIISAVLITLSAILPAQQATDSLFLKNGNLVTGKVIGINDNQYKIKTAEGFLFTFSEEEVGKLILGQRVAPGEIAVFDPDGFGFNLESGLLLGTPNENFFLLASLNTLFTFTIKTRNTIALGAGLEIYDEFYLPIIAEYRFLLLKKNVSPFLYIRGGGLIPAGGGASDTNYKGGWTFGFGTGFRWPIVGFESFIKAGYRYGLTISAGEEWYNAQTTYKYTFHRNYNRLELKWGFIF